MSKHIKTLMGAVVVAAGLSGHAYAGVAPTAASLLLHGQTLNNAISYSTKVPCPDPSATSAAHPGLAKPHKILAHPHPKPKPKIQPAVAVHDASQAPTPIKKVVHVKRKPKPKPSFAPLVLAANQAHMSPIPVASGQSLMSRPVDPPSLCETVHRGDAIAPTPVSNPEPAVTAPDAPFLNPEAAGPPTPGSEASADQTPLSEPFASNPFGGGPGGGGPGGGGGPPGAIGSQALTPPGSGENPPPGGTTPVSPIPEPSDWALMMLGLGAIGSGLRARRRASGTNKQTT
jgi:hypothetical protein